MVRFSWPIFSNATKSKKEEDITLVADYVFALLRLHHDRAMSNERMEVIRRWHHGRLEVKYLTREVNLHERRWCVRESGDWRCVS